MLRRFIFIAVLLTIVLPVFSQETPKTELSADHKEVLRLAQLIRQDPVSETSREYYSAVYKIASEDKQISVAISGDISPWLFKMQEGDKRTGILLAAFVTGNAEAQILENKFVDNPYAGTLFAIFVYTVMKAGDKTFKIPELDKLIALEKAGKLKESFTVQKPSP